MKSLRILGFTFAAFFVLAIIGISIALWVYRDVPIEVLETRYANRASRFINIDGARIHFRDEGKGPAVLLLHANFSNLIDWDPWVDALQDSYRVVRLDFTSHGLTGPDPSNDYSLERTLDLTSKFIDAMDLENISIAGASMGGTIAIRYTHLHPDRIKNLILLSPESLDGNAKMPDSLDVVPDSAHLLAYIMPRALPGFILRSGFGDRDKLTDELIDRWYDLWMHEGQREAQLDRLKQYKAGNTRQIIRTLRLRTLLLRGAEDKTIDFALGDEFLTGFENAASLRIVSYPGVGHWVVQEAGVESARDARQFLDEGRQASQSTAGQQTE